MFVRKFNESNVHKSMVTSTKVNYNTKRSKNVEFGVSSSDLGQDYVQCVLVVKLSFQFSPILAFHRSPFQEELYVYIYLVPIP